MARGTRLALGKEFAGQLFVQGVGLLLVDSGQRRSADDDSTQMVELGGLDDEVADNIAQAGWSGWKVVPSPWRETGTNGSSCAVYAQYAADFRGLRIHI
jgi:hypothetical protein